MSRLGFHFQGRTRVPSAYGFVTDGACAGRATSHSVRPLPQCADRGMMVVKDGAMQKAANAANGHGVRVLETVVPRVRATTKAEVPSDAERSLEGTVEGATSEKRCTTSRGSSKLTKTIMT